MPRSRKDGGITEEETVKIAFRIQIQPNKKMKLLVFIAVAAAAWVLPRVNAAGSATPITNAGPVEATAAPLGDPVVAKVSGFEIRRSQMDQVLATARANNPQDELPADAEVHVINQLIEMQLVLQKATEAEKAEGKQQADEKFAQISKTLNATEFERRLKATHMTADDLRFMLCQEDTAQASLTRQLGIKVTDADAQKWFDDHPGAYDQPETACVREILLLTTSDFTTSAAPPLPEAAIQAKHRQIFELQKRARAGEDFAALAQRYNEDPVSKDNGGKLWFRRDQMEFGDLAYSLKTNQISDVVTNVEGYRFFQLLEIRPAQKAEFANLADTLKKMLAGRLKRTLAPAYIKQLRKEADVEILDPGLKAKVAAAEAEAAEAANIPPAKPQ
jgi:peptidyl-prolyl cis-trans isomerase SurA